MYVQSVSLGLSLPSYIFFQSFTSYIHHHLLHFCLSPFRVSVVPILSLSPMLYVYLLHSLFFLFFLLLLFEHAHTFLFSSLSSTCFLCFPPPPHFLHTSFFPPFPFWGYNSGVAVADACLPGFWAAAGVCNDHGKTYALYAITVYRRNQDGSEECWKTYRRYSDFHDFHMRITEQVQAGPPVPGTACDST